jgi:transporter family-2 protein
LILVAVVGGAAISLQGHFMGIMDTRLGTIESVFITYGGGGLLIGLVMLAYRGGNLAAWQSTPWYVLLSGALGLLIVGSIGYSAPRLGLVAAFTVIICSQLAVAAVLDHFGILGAEVRPLTVSRLAGIGVVLLGVWLTLR